MNKFLIATLCLSNVFLFGCAENNQTVNGVNTNTTTVTTANQSGEMPKTEKVDKDFVESETGTEKAKPEAGKANVQGQVLYNGKPVEGIEVRLCEKFSRFLGGSCDGENFKTKTDANGEYLFANITPIIYEGLLVKVFNTDSVVFATKGIGISTAKYKIEPDKTFFAPETNLFKDDLKIQSPKAKAKVDAKMLDIKWDAYPDAAYYKLNLMPEEYDRESSISDQKIEGTEYKVEKNLKSGEYRIRLAAYNASDVKLADTGDDVEFTVTGGDAAASGNPQ